jgi:hypothetical protein
MNSYRVAATGEPRTGDPKGRLYHVDITVEGYDDHDAMLKGIAYLDRVYASYKWRADAVNQLATRRPPTRRRPKLIRHK